MAGAVGIASVPGVCDVSLVASGPPRWLIELPHGATRAADYEALRSRLRGAYPDGLRDFFFVNTDVGCFESACEIARRLAADGSGSVLLLRSLIPRTFVDCNRGLDERSGEVTPVLPDYIREPQDIAELERLHRSYHAVADEAYARVCKPGGIALALHTYAPRSVKIERFDETIGEQLRRAYAPEVYAEWEARPDVDVISQSADGVELAPPALTRAVRERFAAIGVRATENASYRLHPSTMGYRYSALYPGRVICIEINRACLAQPFAPFEEMHIAPEKVARMAAPIADALGRFGA